MVQSFQVCQCSLNVFLPYRILFISPLWNSVVGITPGLWVLCLIHKRGSVFTHHNHVNILFSHTKADFHSSQSSNVLFMCLLDAFSCHWHIYNIYLLIKAWPQIDFTLYVLIWHCAYLWKWDRVQSTLLCESENNRLFVLILH